MMGISKIKANSNSQETTRRRAPKRERERERSNSAFTWWVCTYIYTVYTYRDIKRGEI